ncbi:hypothetical protein B5S28_g4172 [[Candida] boidinii]|nr:hypothetical protein B5S28_g4172 [[Candida] boidinii]
MESTSELEKIKEKLQSDLDKNDDHRRHHRHGHSSHHHSGRDHSRHNHSHHYHNYSDKNERNESGKASSGTGSSHRSSSHRHGTHRHSSRSSHGSKSHSNRHSHRHSSHSHHCDSPSNKDEIKEEEEEQEENSEFPGYKIVEAPDFSDEEQEKEFTNESNENILNRTRNEKGDLNFNILESFYNHEPKQIPVTTDNNNNSSNKRKGRFELDVQPNDFNQGKKNKTDSKISNLSKKSCLDIKYEFGDRGSSWRMMKLNKTFEDAKENNLDIEESALNKYSSLKEFYIALEEEEEIKKRKILRLTKDKFKLKPVGNIILSKGLKIEDDDDDDEQKNNDDDKEMERKQFNEFLKNQITDKITLEQVNNAKIEMMKSKLKKTNDFKELESIYNTLKLKFELQNDINIENSITNKQFDKIYLKNQILNDKLFNNKDLNNQDDNLNNLSNLINNDSNLINLQDLIQDNNMSELKKFNDSISNCFFCKLLLNEKNNNSIILKNFNHFYLINSKQPEITATTNGLMIIPKLHISNSLKLDNEIYKELQEIFKLLKNFYFKKFNKKILIIENSIYKQNHFKINIIPINLKFNKFEIFNYFKIGIIEQIKNEFDISNKLIIDTLNYSNNHDIDAFKALIPKEAPFFHCIIELGKGGIGTIVEDIKHWPKDELFFRRIIGGFLNVDKFKIESYTKNINSKDSIIFKNLKFEIDEFFNEYNKSV